MRALLTSTDPRAAEAVALFVYRVGRELGSLAAALGGLDALVFAGGVGENAAAVRTAACESFGFLGIELDEQKNVQSPADEDIAAPDSAVRVVIVHTQEDWAIAQDCWNLARTQGH